MSGPKVTWELVGDATKSHQAIESVGTKAQGLTGRLGSVGKGMVLGAGIASFNLLTSAIDLGIGKLGEARQAFLDDQVSVVKLGNSLKNNIPNWDGNTAGVEKYAAAQGALGFADETVRDSIGQLVGVTHDLAKAQELNSLAQDLARAKGLDLATASDIVTKAYQGNGKALKGLGIDIAGAKSGAELLDAVQKNVTGSAEKWAQTSEGRTAVSQVKVGEAMEKVGGVIDKIAVVAIPILADAFVFLADVIGNVGAAVEPIIGAIGDAMRNLMPTFRTVAAVVEGIVRGMVAIWGAEFKIALTVLGRLGDAFRAIGAVVGSVFGTIGAVVKAGINLVIGAVNAVVRAINGIQLHIDIRPPIGPNITFDWNGMNLRQLPYLHAGGIVPGPAGADVLAILQAGERVLPAGGGGAPVTINVVIDGQVVASVVDRYLYRTSQRAAPTLGRT